MGLITIDDVNEAVGEDVPEDDEERVEWYIEVVSDFLEQYTGRTFSEQSDVTMTTRANSWGIIEFPELTSISTVEMIDGNYGGFLPVTYRFDGIGSIYDLVPYGVYRVTVTYGSDTVPDAIRRIATLLVMAGTGYDPSAIGGLTKIKTGNVEDTYGVAQSGAVTLSGLMEGVLQDYDVGMSRP